MRDIYVDELYEVSVDDEGFVRVSRTANPVDDLDRFAESLRSLAAAIRAEVGEGKKGRGILMDFRKARSRNDDAFEQMTSSYRQVLRGTFHRVALLAETQVGRLHIARLDREEGTNTPVFEDEASALAHLRGEGRRSDA